MRTVETKLAFEFQCPACGAQAFTSAVIAEFSAEDRQEQIELMGHQLKIGEWITCPEVVTCDRCGEEFSAKQADQWRC